MVRTQAVALAIAAALLLGLLALWTAEPARSGTQSGGTAVESARLP